MTWVSYLNQWFKLSDTLGGMSFNVAVVVKDGRATVETSGEVPDGELIVSGHEDDRTRTLSLVRRGADGRYVQQATAVHHKEIA